ncbi:ABC transporter permease [Enterovibrio norvegicus]|uniref:ABC-2 type transport system permease protein n=2 Tax=Enterovibrio norvegicus TaxID=188144 RepID=A0A1I5M094_9GAMM|nr:ABC transporter permease [Enterovibrio norvegicus]OEF55815.1 ABC transporter [Enterovibrio norvegicus]PMH64927.1 ABC transporter [Enterovibrio norvegicus]SFP02431.1 ABC-2 type transport system permease protein [Enterovibrio norvegicus DSM 15893]
MSWRDVFINELRRLFSNPAVVFTVFGGIIIYSLLYPLPYANQLPRELHIAIVDHDQSQQSRTFIRMLDATPQVQVVKQLGSETESSPYFASAEIEGVVTIPQHFYRDLLLGKSPVVSVGGDASFFLTYGTIVEGVVATGSTLGAQVKVQRALMHDTPMPLATTQYAPFSLNAVPVFNPTTGYGDYVVPGVFMLILQQTLLIASGMLGISNGNVNTNANAAKITVRNSKSLWARTIILTGIYCIMAMYYLGASLSLNGVNRMAEPLQLAAVILPFLLATIGLGSLIGIAIKRAEIITLIVLLSSMPLLFIAGFVWPSSALPTWLSVIAQFAPSTVVIQATLQLNQMGADFQSQLGHLTQLWLQAAAYLGLAFYLKRKATRAA